MGAAGCAWATRSGPPERQAELAWTFKEMCDRHAAWSVFYQVSPQNLPLYLDLGLSALKIGEEARVPLTDFTLAGGKRKRLRNLVNRAQGEDCSFGMLTAEQTRAELPRLQEVSNAWLRVKNTHEKGFSLGFFTKDYIARTPTAVVRRGDEIVAFANVWLARDGTEISVDLMRHTESAPSGVMDLLFAGLMEWGRDHGYAWFNLGMAPLAGLKSHTHASAWSKVGAFVFRHGEHFYQFEGLRKYKDKFYPAWQPRDLVTSAGLALPRIVANLTALIGGRRQRRRPPAAAAMWIAGALVALCAALAPRPLVAAPPAKAVAKAPAKKVYSHGPFGRVHVRMPKKPPERLLLFVTGDGGWDKHGEDIAMDLSELPAIVVGIDLRRYRAAIRRSKKKCIYAAAHFEALSQSIQRQLGLGAYIEPILVGHSTGASLVYAILAQAPKGTFAGAVSMSFDPIFELPKPLCQRNGLRIERAPRGRERDRFRLLESCAVPLPWVSLHGARDAVSPAKRAREFACTDPKGKFVLLPKVGHGFAASQRWLKPMRKAIVRIEELRAAGGPGSAGKAYNQTAPVPAPQAATPTTSPRAAVTEFVGPPLSAAGPAPLAPLMPDPKVSDLPLHPVPTARQGGDFFVLLVTGDGGWAGIDQDMAAALKEQGIPTVGLNALKYFWKRRSPEQGAADLARIIAWHVARWGRSKVVLVGYSLGADVLPPLIHPLPPAYQQRIAGVVLLGPSRTYDLEFHIGNWAGAGSRHDRPLLPEILRLKLPIICVHGTKETGSLCKASALQKRATVHALPGGHHFGGDAKKLAEIIIAAGRSATSP